MPLQGIGTAPRGGLWLLLALGCLGPATAAQEDAAVWDRKQQKKVAALAERWWKARPPTRFDDWDAGVRAELEAEARELGGLPEGARQEAVEILWKPAAKHGPGAKAKKGSATIETPYGEAKFLLLGKGKGKGLLIGLHGGGEDAGSASEAKGSWQSKACLGIYPQGIRLVHDTWNTVHGERFILSLIEIAKVQHDIDPDRVYCMGFSMGGSGSWFMAGRHPDLLAGAAPCAGVLMAAPESQLATKEEVQSVQHGLVPNVRNLAMWYYIGLEDRNCMPGTYLYVADMLGRLREKDPSGYQKVHFETYPGLAHAFPPGEPAKGIEYLTEQRRDTFPETVVWEYTTGPYPLPIAEDKTARLQKHHFYWLHCANPIDRQSIRATRVENTIELEVSGTADGVHGLTLFLNESMIDPAQDVVVRAGDEEVYRGRPVPDLWTVLETMDARADRSMVFDRRIEL